MNNIRAESAGIKQAGAAVSAGGNEMQVIQSVVMALPRHGGILRPWNRTHRKNRDVCATRDPVGSGCQAYESIQYAGLYTDGTSGNDLATHRQLSDTYYRWLSPDPSGVKVVNLSDPQTWNMYAYALDNPTSLNDPSGLRGCPVGQYKGCAAGSGIKKTYHGVKPHGSAPGVNSEVYGNIIYNEVGGVRPTSKSGKGSAKNLQSGRVAIGHVLINRHNAHKPGGVASSTVPLKDRNNSEYRDSQAAAAEAVHTPDTTHGAIHFYLHYAGEPTPSWARGKTPVATYGPFVNSAGHGDVPLGAKTWIIIIQ